MEFLKTHIQAATSTARLSGGMAGRSRAFLFVLLCEWAREILESPTMPFNSQDEDIQSHTPSSSSSTFFQLKGAFPFKLSNSDNCVFFRLPIYDKLCYYSLRRLVCLRPRKPLIIFAIGTLAAFFSS